MKIELEPDKYIVAVSGGVDSVVLLDLLCKQMDEPEKNLVVGHFDHGIRKTSKQDRKFVERLAENKGLKFFYEDGKLGPQASEALAREKRYEFLEKIKNKTDSAAILTAHHSDDVLETIIINLLRGTGRKGLSSLSSRPGLKRPLLNFKKEEILDYANKNRLDWREDETNAETKYLRNYVRHKLVNKLTDGQKEQLLEISNQARLRNAQIDGLIADLFIGKDELPRNVFAGLGHDISSEIIAGWLRREQVRFDKKTIERLVVKLKTADENKIIQAPQGRYFSVRKGVIRMNTPRPV